MPTYTCRRCEYTQDTPWPDFCPGCLGPYRYKKHGVGSDDPNTDGFRTMGSGRSAGKHNYLSTGQESFDKVLGGGLVAGRVVLLGGFAGSGKTRLLLMTADYIGKTQGVVIYASGEESENDVNGTAADLGLVNDKVIILGNQRSVEKVLEVAKKTKAFLIIWDSAQKFASDYAGGNPGSQAQCKAIGEAIKYYCGKNKVCSIIVNQMSNQGDLKGGTELEHHCDTIMVLAYPKPDDEDAPLIKDVRLLDGGKNRCGPENIRAYLAMDENGRLNSVEPRSRIISEDDQNKSKYKKIRS